MSGRCGVGDIPPNANARQERLVLETQTAPMMEINLPRCSQIRPHLTETGSVANCGSPLCVLRPTLMTETTVISKLNMARLAISPESDSLAPSPAATVLGHDPQWRRQTSLSHHSCRQAGCGYGGTLVTMSELVRHNVPGKRACLVGGYHLHKRDSTTASSYVEDEVNPLGSLGMTQVCHS
ncbi:hypothetical protein EMCRGX_G012818 [Ephydatia muelleri]